MENEPTPKANAVWADVKDLVRSHPAATVLLLLLLATSTVAPIYSVTTLNDKLNALHSNICTVVVQTAKGQPALQKQWLLAAQASTAASKHENPGLAHADIRAAAADLRIAAAYAPHPAFTFPGC